MSSLIDRIAVVVGTWALHRLYGSECETYVWEDFPNEPDTECLSCHATVLTKSMKELFS